MDRESEKNKYHTNNLRKEVSNFLRKYSYRLVFLTIIITLDQIYSRDDLIKFIDTSNIFVAQYHHLFQTFSYLLPLAGVAIAYGMLRIAKSNLVLAKEKEDALHYQISSDEKKLIRQHWKKAQDILAYILNKQYDADTYTKSKDLNGEFRLLIQKNALHPFSYLKENSIMIIRDQNLILLIDETYNKIFELQKVVVELIQNGGETESHQLISRHDHSYTDCASRTQEIFLDRQNIIHKENNILKEIKDLYAKLRNSYAKILTKELYNEY